MGDRLPNIQRSRKPRKLTVVKPSKYEAAEAIHSNKKYWGSVFNELDLAETKPNDKQRSLKLSNVLPPEVYNKVCDILKLPIAPEFDERETKVTDIARQKITKRPLISYRKTILIERELDSDTDVEFSPREESEDVPNVHLEFLSRPEREQITWETRYLQPEREDEKTLERRANDLTDRIAKEFCDFMKQLGGNQQSQLFTPKAIKELFQVEFDTHVARSLRVIPKELPVVNEKVADVTGNPDKSLYATLKREVAKDIKEENRPDSIQGFGRSLARQDQRRAPRNDTRYLWRSARHVPKDLVTLKTVWEGITNLRSVKEYCRWMIEHPEHRRAPYLRSLGMFDSAVLQARLTFESQQGHLSPHIAPPRNTPGSIDDIRQRLSELSGLD